MWLFHFRIGGERKNGSKENSEGIGHAVRCLRLIAFIEEKYKIQSIIATSDNSAAKRFLDEKSVNFQTEDALKDVLNRHTIDVVVSDINYLDKSYFDLYKEQASRPICVSLAPRGQSKYYADIAFKDVIFNDEEPLAYSKSKIFSGLQYVVTSDKFNDARKKLDQGVITKEKNSIIISMGGMDHFDMTKKALIGLQGIAENYELTIVLGPLYLGKKNIEDHVRKNNLNAKIVQNPDNFHHLLAKATIGIFGSGIVSYEALGLGVLGFNMGTSVFHEKRSQELESLGLGVHLGDSSMIEYGCIADKINKMSSNKNYSDKMRCDGLKSVDGEGVRRIINQILEQTPSFLSYI